jgi:hypothetical protein
VQSLNQEKVYQTIDWLSRDTGKKNAARANRLVFPVMI